MHQAVSYYLMQCWHKFTPSNGIYQAAMISFFLGVDIMDTNLKYILFDWNHLNWIAWISFCSNMSHALILMINKHCFV